MQRKHNVLQASKLNYLQICIKNLVRNMYRQILILLGSHYVTEMLIDVLFCSLLL